MRRLLAFTAAAVLALADAAADDALKLVTWNVQWYPGHQPFAKPIEEVEHATAARKALLELKPDILCLQEVKTQEAAEALVAILPDHELHVVSRFPAVAGSAQQLAISSRLPAKAVDWVAFERTALAPPRGFVYAIFDLGQTHLMVYCVHFKSNSGGIEKNIGIREESARQLVRHVELTKDDFRREGVETFAVVLAGDFNTDPYDERFLSEATGVLLEKAGFRNAWEGVPFKERITWPGDGNYPDACFDHVWTLGAIEHQLMRVIATAASDHLPAAFTFAVSSAEHEPEPQ